MSSLGAMIERIGDELDDAGLDTQIARAIQSAIKFHERRRFYFNARTFTFATEATREYYDVDDAADIATFIEVDSQYLTSSGYRYPITVTDFATMDASQNGSVTGRPTNWAFFAQQFRLFPIPDAVYTVTVAGHCRLDTITDPGDGNAWFQDAEELIRQGAKRRLAMDVTKSVEDAQAAQALEAEALESLLLETQRRRGRPLLRMDPALVSSAPWDINQG